jgi:TrpR family trp operon transcriptional repressor
MNKKTEEDGWRGFLEHCKKAKTVKELEKYFHLFLTPTERQEISGRYLIVQALLKGEKTQREIAKDLEVSIANISRGSNMLKTTEPDLKKFLES